MRYKLVIAEKPSVAQSLAAVIGATARKDGYLEGTDWLVSLCVGHLAGLAAESRSSLYEYVSASCSDWWFWYGEYFIVRIVEISVCSNGRGFVDSYLWLGKEPCGIESEKSGF